LDSIWRNSNIDNHIACLTRFRLISHPFKIPIESPQAHGDSLQSPYPSHTHTNGNPMGIPIPTAALQIGDHNQIVAHISRLGRINIVQSHFVFNFAVGKLVRHVRNSDRRVFSAGSHR